MSFTHRCVFDFDSKCKISLIHLHQVVYFIEPSRALISTAGFFVNTAILHRPPRRTSPLVPRPQHTYKHFIVVSGVSTTWYIQRVSSCQNTPCSWILISNGGSSQILGFADLARTLNGTLLPSPAPSSQFPVGVVCWLKIDVPGGFDGEFS